MADYKEDVEDLAKVIADTPQPEIQETKAAKRLFKSVDRMIGKMDKVGFIFFFQKAISYIVDF